MLAMGCSYTYVVIALHLYKFVGGQLRGYITGGACISRGVAGGGGESL